MAGLGMAFADNRASPRDEVYHRAQAIGPDGGGIVLLIVNLSA
ncbi:hypothetical protein ACFOKI_12905 [Sphingomonas qilianensis]|uniref:Uncharacterized protein n=1 Tax=Sphingomonas qilianensis TaxID=1736690 RepID=A0ABU9XQL2_9SPHN